MTGENRHHGMRATRSLRGRKYSWRIDIETFGHKFNG